MRLARWCVSCLLVTAVDTLLINDADTVDRRASELERFEFASAPRFAFADALQANSALKSIAFNGAMFMQPRFPFLWMPSGSQGYQTRLGFPAGWGP